MRALLQYLATFSLSTVVRDSGFLPDRAQASLYLSQQPVPYLYATRIQHVESLMFMHLIQCLKQAWNVLPFRSMKTKRLAFKSKHGALRSKHRIEGNKPHNSKNFGEQMESKF